MSLWRAPGILAISIAAVQCQPRPELSSAPEYGYRVVHVYPHDRSAFTQGLEYRGGFLYEGTGLNGRSALRKVELETGKLVQETKLAPQFFGEGSQ